MVPSEDPFDAPKVGSSGRGYSIGLPAAEPLRAAVQELSQTSAVKDFHHWWIYHQNSRRKLMYAKYHIERLKEIKGRICQATGGVALVRSAGKREFSVPLHAHVEAFLVTTCCAFDSLAQELNVLLELGVCDEQVTVRKVHEVIHEVVKERSDLAEVTLALDALVNAPEFSELRRFRGYAVHRGQVMLQDIVFTERAGTRAGLILSVPDQPDPTKGQLGLASERATAWLADMKGREVESWCGRMVDFAAQRVDCCYSKLADVLRAQGAEPIIAGERPDLYASLGRSSPEYCVVHFLRKLRDREYEFAYAILATEWQAELTADAFRARWEGTEILEFSLGQRRVTLNSANCTVHERVRVGGVEEERVEILTAERRGGSWRLVPNDFNVPTPTVSRLSVVDLRRRQSGPETGHRDLIFEATITNLSCDPLLNVRAAVHHDEWIDTVRQDIGDLQPGESKNVHIVFKDAAAIPCVGARPLYEPSRIRVVYAVGSGEEWAEEFPFPAPTNPSSP